MRNVRYMARQKAWSADATARINAFAESIAPLFENADAPSTDIHAALLRADIFVSEPNAFAQPAENVVILVTDGVETVDPQTPAQKRHAMVEVPCSQGVDFA